MAKGNATTVRASTRDYVVMKVDGTSLTVLDPKVAAKDANSAMDIVAEKLVPEQRNGKLGAFLLSSYREQEFKTKQEWTTTKKPAAPSFAGNGAAAPKSVPV